MLRGYEAEGAFHDVRDNPEKLRSWQYQSTWSEGQPRENAINIDSY